MKKTVLWFLKAVVAALIAFGLLSVFSFFYYNLPIHHTETTGSSDYSWDPKAFCARGTEGFSFQFTDENGYVNSYPNQGDQVDILVMGSSHSEGFNVNYNENYTYVLNELLQERKHDLYAYSVATSGHDFERNLRNLESAIKRFQPQKYVVIEVMDLNIRIQKLQRLLGGKLGVLASVNSGLVGTLQKSDALRLMYYQLNQLSENQAKAGQPAQLEQDLALLEQCLDQSLANAGATARANGCQLILTSLSPVEFDYEGNLYDPMAPQIKEMYQRICEKYDILFLDMYPAYEQMYNSTGRLPRGFSNTAPGVGHTNKYGHACVARELYKCITKEDIE